MPGTPRLYYQDSLLFSFGARVVDHAEIGGVPSVLLDRTAFFPESGGQMADRGSLGGLRVIDVQVDDAGTVHHVVEGPPPAVGDDVRCEIDAPRRRQHMALHTAQHMLSRALVDVAGAETVSSRLGETVCTIDVDLAELGEGAVARAEDMVNAVIDDDAVIRAFFPDAVELASLPLRRRPKVATDVRVVAIGDFDVSPCGGTHCLRTAQVGLVRVSGVERYKGKMRVSFNAGRRAREELGRQSSILSALGREFTCGLADVPAAVGKLSRELKTAREALGEARALLAERSAAELVEKARQRGDTRVRAVFPSADVAFLRAVAKRVTAEPGFVALLAAPGDEGQPVLAARGPGSDFDCGAFLKGVAAAHGGRGGGRPEVAEGRLARDVDWLEATSPVSGPR
jgi:alanyl-tRNA synthetase